MMMDWNRGFAEARHDKEMPRDRSMAYECGWHAGLMMLDAAAERQRKAEQQDCDYWNTIADAPASLKLFG